MQRRKHSQGLHIEEQDIKSSGVQYQTQYR